TKPNISTNNLTRSGLLPLGGRYIIGRESPTATNEKPRADSFAAVPSSAAAAGPATSGNTAMNANNIEQTFVVGCACFIFFLPLVMRVSLGFPFCLRTDHPLRRLGGVPGWPVA